MIQMTAKELYDELHKVIKAGHGDKRVVIANDNEGNGYHGMFCGVLDDPEEIEVSIEAGLNDSEETDPNNIVIVG